MITYAERVCFRSEHLRLLAATDLCVARVGKHWGNELRCHELARAVHATLRSQHAGLVDRCSLIVVDGKCGPVEHSWLVGAGIILDPYAPGRLPAVQIVDALLAVMYQAGAARRDIKRGIVTRLVHEMRSTAREPSAVEKS